MTYTAKGLDIKMKTVKATGKQGSSGIVYLPKEWIGKEVAIILEPQ